MRISKDQLRKSVNESIKNTIRYHQSYDLPKIRRSDGSLQNAPDPKIDSRPVNENLVIGIGIIGQSSVGP